MKQREASIPLTAESPLLEPLRRLKQLYAATGRSSEAAQWERKLADFQETETAKTQIRVALRCGRDACQASCWAEAAKSFAAALQHPSYDWELAWQNLEMPQYWMALAFVRAGDSGHHRFLCQELTRKPRRSRGDVVRAILLPPNPGPELLSLASNAIPKSELVLTNNPEGLAWFRFHRSLLEYRSGRYAEALASARQAGEGRAPVRPVYAMIIQSMASQRLGQQTEARSLWQQTIDSISKLRRGTGDLATTRDLLLVQVLMDQAADLLGLDEQKAALQMEGALGQ